VEERGCEAISLATEWAMDRCRHEMLLHVQADEVLHPIYLPSIAAAAATGRDAYKFRRLWLGMNFQKARTDSLCTDGIHNVVRMGRKGKVKSVGDGCSWETDEPAAALTPHDRDIHLFDVSYVFVEDFPARARNYASIWHPKAAYPRTIKWHDGRSSVEWERTLFEWRVDGFPIGLKALTSPFMKILPPCLRRLVGKTKYELFEGYLK
jgi:hypothetical protein